MVGLDTLGLTEKINYVILQLVLHVTCLLGGDGDLRERLVLRHIHITPLRPTRLGRNHTEGVPVDVRTLTGGEWNLLRDILSVGVNSGEIVQNLNDERHLYLSSVGDFDYTEIYIAESYL